MLVGLWIPGGREARVWVPITRQFLNTFVNFAGHWSRKEMALLTKTCIYCVFGSVLGALGNKIKEVMA